MPSIALGSSLVLALERAALVGALLGLMGIFLLRGWSGYFPSKVSTTGAEYAAVAEASRSDTAASVAVRELALCQQGFGQDLESLAARLKEIEMKADML